jgi:hypothetical protein
LINLVAVEKVGFPKESRNLDDRKCLGDSEKSLVELPDANQFLRNRSERVFQHPPDFSTVFGDVLEAAQVTRLIRTERPDRSARVMKDGTSILGT